MISLPDNLRAVFEAVRMHTESGVTIADICRHPEVKKLRSSDEELRSYVNFATEKLVSLGYIRIRTHSRPKTFMADSESVEKIVIDKVNDLAKAFFRGDVGALIQFVNAAVKKQRTP